MTQPRPRCGGRGISYTIPTQFLHIMHINSLNTYQEEMARLSKRAKMILSWLLTKHAQDLMPLTDREIKDGMRFTEMNMVRPRITEMIKKGLLIECGSTTCRTTGKTVRLIAIPKAENPNQMKLFEE
jgi:hypothetical protein